jgi:hypothetical protein
VIFISTRSLSNQHQQKSASELMAGTMAVSRLLYRKERGKDGKREKDVQVFCT